MININSSEFKRICNQHHIDTMLELLGYEDEDTIAKEIGTSVIRMKKCA